MTAVRKSSVRNASYAAQDDRYSVSVMRAGKLVKGFDPACTASVEEEVMRWRDANHIHAWFVKNVQNGKDDNESHQVTSEDLRTLLTVCEQVLFGSHLVQGQVSNPMETTSFTRRAEAVANASKVIRNVSVAAKLLPLKSYGPYKVGHGEYGEEYLNDVEATRAWAERMLIELESDSGGIRGEIYYSSRC